MRTVEEAEHKAVLSFDCFIEFWVGIYVAIFSLSLPVSPRAPQPNPILLSYTKHVSSDWLRFWKIVANHRTGSGKTVLPFTIIWNNNAIVHFRVRYDRWIKEVKTHFLQP